ncbi:MAG: hypothetical protein IJP88_05980 [Synergistaceae bacterium]|nr:hypothetical protein [Synergistaceae bacterium]
MALGTVNVPGYIPADFDAVNSKIGDLNNLNTTDKSNLVAAINEVDGDITTAASIASSAQTLANTASSSAASAQTLANTASSSAASAQTLANTAAGNASTALTRIGDLSSLNTETKTNLVAALNEIIETGVASGSDPEFTLSAVNAEINVRSYTAEIICAYKGSGQLLVVSAEPDIISVAIEDQSTSGMNVKKIILTRVGYSQDDTTINIALTSDGEHVAANGTITVAGTPYVIGATLEDTDWANIQTVGAMGIGANFFDIGDTKTITLNGNIGDYFTASNLQLKVFIIEFNYRGDNGIYFQGFKSMDGIDVALCDSRYGNANLNSGSPIGFMINTAQGLNSNNCGNASGWKGCLMRYKILGSVERSNTDGLSVITNKTNLGYDATETAKTSPVANTLMAALPADLRAALAQWRHYANNKGQERTTAGSDGNATCTVYSKDSITLVTDYITLLSAYEVAGDNIQAISKGWMNPYENLYMSQMAYYANGNTLIKYKHNAPTTACAWRVSSPADGGRDWMLVNTKGVVHAGEGSDWDYDICPNTSTGLAPAFRVA